jgi:hypothetical protein
VWTSAQNQDVRFLGWAPGRRLPTVPGLRSSSLTPFLRVRRDSRCLIAEGAEDAEPRGLFLGDLCALCGERLLAALATGCQPL